MPIAGNPLSKLPIFLCSANLESSRRLVVPIARYFFGKAKPVALG